jgi:hypothetical protein
VTPKTGEKASKNQHDHPIEKGNTTVEKEKNNYNSFYRLDQIIVKMLE